MRIEPRPSGPALLPAPDPSRKTAGYADKAAYIAFPGGGTGHDAGVSPNDKIGYWIARFNRWRSGFEQGPGPKARRYWSLYRAFDEGQLPGPNQEWRDRTVIPQSFKVIETKVPRIVLGLWGQPENIAVEGRGFRDARYENKVRVILQTLLDEMGKGQAQSELFIKRAIDAERYKQIVGHVWWKVMWRQDHDWIKTKIPEEVSEDGTIRSWKPVEVKRPVYDGVEATWLPLDSLAVDLAGIGGNRRWAIERFQTSFEQLEAENKKFKAIHHRDLYKNLELVRFNQEGSTPLTQRESYEEPRDTEHWPLTDDQITDDPGETKVEMWLCWDNIDKTLTKIANRSIELDYGLAPTPDGLDPYIGVPAVPVPGRVYGESMLHWIGPLAQYQTRIARARADEILLNIWQQYIYREGALRSTQWFWRPGGGMGIETEDPSHKISDSIAMLPRRPVFQEAFSEEAYRQQQGEAVAGADAVSQGVEATSKSRDVSATEVNQRVLQGASRHQLEILYNEVCWKKPLLQKMFDLAQMNMTEAKQIRITEDQEETESIDLRDLDRPIDIVVGGGLRESTQQEKLNELREIRDLGESVNYGPYVRHGDVANELVKATRTLGKNSSLFIRTEEEVMKRAQAQAQAAAQTTGAGTNGQSGQPSTVLPGPIQGSKGGSPGPGGLNGANGTSPEAPPAQSGPSSVEI